MLQLVRHRATCSKLYTRHCTALISRFSEFKFVSNDNVCNETRITSISVIFTTEAAFFYMSWKLAENEKVVYTSKYIESFFVRFACVVKEMMRFCQERFGQIVFNPEFCVSLRFIDFCYFENLINEPLFI